MSDSPGKSDFGTLLANARAGDAAALTRLVAEYEPEVRMVARMRLSSALRPYLDSVDVVQSVHKSLMLGLQEAKYDISSPEQLVALALTMVRRKIAKQWRRMKRQTRLESGGTNSDPMSQLLATLSSADASPEALAVRQEELERLFSQLTADERTLIDLRLDGYSTAEAARELGLDPDVLRVYLSRLRKRFRASGVMVDLI